MGLQVTGVTVGLQVSGVIVGLWVSGVTGASGLRGRDSGASGLEGLTAVLGLGADCGASSQG